MEKATNRRVQQELIHSGPYKSISLATTARIRHEEKKSGHYERHTAMQKVSFGERHVEKSSGHVGVKNECKKTSTVKVGNNRGYTEYYTEQRVRKVDFSKYNSSNSNNYGNGANKPKDKNTVHFEGPKTVKAAAKTSSQSRSATNAVTTNTTLKSGFEKSVTVKTSRHSSSTSTATVKSVSVKKPAPTKSSPQPRLVTMVTTIRLH